MNMEFIIGLSIAVDTRFVNFEAKLDTFENGQFIDTQSVPMILCPIDHEAVELIDKDMGTTWPGRKYA